MLHLFVRKFDQTENILHTHDMLDNLDQNESESFLGFIERFVILANKCNLPEPFQVSWIPQVIP